VRVLGDVVERGIEALASKDLARCLEDPEPVDLCVSA
jgi:hypothetical protein